jgi:PAS domain S-box-containing protein
MAKTGLIIKNLFTRKVRSSYESELKITLLLILLFLILANFSTLRVTGKLSKIYKEDNYNQLEIGADKLIDYVKNDVSILRLTKNFKEKLAYTLVSGAAFVPRRYLDSPADYPDFARTGESDYMRGYYSQLSSENRAKLDNGKIVKCGFGVGRDSDKIVILYPFNDSEGRQWVGMFFKNAGGLKLVTTIMRFNYIFQIAGILAILLVAYAYLKITLNPFREIASEAKRLHSRDPHKGESVEQIVETFKQTIAKLQENEEKLKQLYSNSQKRADRLEQFNQYILESILSGLIGIDNKGRVVHLNPIARKILELNEEKVNSESYLQTLSDYRSLADILTGIIEHKTAVERLEERIVRKSGSEKILGISGSPVYDHMGRTVGAILLLADMTEVRRLQSEVAFKEKMAAVGEMSAGLAHELRNAMMAIVGYSKFLTKLSVEDARIQEIALSINSESTNCETMLKRFLMFAKPISFTPEPLTLPEIADAVVQKLAHLAAADKIEISAEYAVDLPDYMGDRTALDQIITNLVKNAVEAAPANGAVFVKVGHNFEENSFLLEISDNGPGIPPENRQKIFSPFFTTREKGTGLGLAIVKKLITSLGGKIDLDSDFKAGCRFIVSLPANYTSQNGIATQPKEVISQS